MSQAAIVLSAPLRYVGFYRLSQKLATFGLSVFLSPGCFILQRI